MPQPLILTSQLPSETASRTLRRDRDDGHVERLRRGVYLPGDDWESLDHRLRHVVVVIAQLCRLESRVVVSHGSAGALWGLPALDGHPGRVHVYDLDRTRAQTTPTLVRHVTSEPLSTTAFAGYSCTSAARTAVDMGLDGLASALLAFDHGLKAGLFDQDELEAEVGMRRRVPGVGFVRRALEYATPLAGSPAESISRAVVIEEGFPMPTLQKRFPNPLGGSFYVDFWWPEFGIIGEFDGHEKYRSEAMRRGLSLEEVLLLEKDRSDALRARPEVKNLVRWNYATARARGRLAAVLLSAGLPRVR